MTPEILEVQLARIDERLSAMEGRQGEMVVLLKDLPCMDHDRRITRNEARNGIYAIAAGAGVGSLATALIARLVGG